MALLYEITLLYKLAHYIQMALLYKTAPYYDLTLNYEIAQINEMALIYKTSFKFIYF